ncbi:MAG: QueT transporter family protein [Lachnospiraceae bacterium]|nr:QueT transporter family protein [Lachnospiraceae bacterium]
MEKRKNNLKNVYLLAYGAAIAAIYVTLTMVFAPISFGPIQFRISEILCVLPFFTPAAVPGLFLGCFLANLFCGAAVLDVVFGSLATLIGAAGSLYLGKKSRWLVCLPPILANTVIIPWVLRYAYGSTDLIPFAMVTVGVGEILAIGVLGNMLLFTLDRYKGLLFKKSLA